MKMFRGAATLAAVLLAGSFIAGASGCSIFKATGQSVEAIGEGAGTAVRGTGRAIGDAADESKETLTGKKSGK